MKKILSTLLAAAMVLSLAACSGGNPNSSTASSGSASSGSTSSEGTSSAASTDTGSSEGVTINFYEHSDNEKILKDMVEAYNKLDNGVTVALHTIPNDDYDDKLKVLTAGGSEDVDACWIRSPGQMIKYMQNDVLLDLAPYAEKSGLDLAPIETTLAAVTREGSFYGLPTTSSAWMLFYNKDLFDAKGLEYPVNLTWDEYCDLAKELTYEENGTKYWGGVAPDWSLDLGAAAAGEYLTAEQPMETTRTYLETLHRMYSEDKSHPSIQEMSGGAFDINAAFTAGNIYMMINGDWTFNLLEPDFAYGAAPYPTFEGGVAEATVGQNAYFSVLSSSKHPQEAYDFIEWCNTSPEGTAIYAKNQGVPCYATDEALAAYEETVKVEGVAYRFSAKISPETGTEDYYGDVLDAFNEEMKLYLLDEESLDDAFNNFFELRDEIIANNS